MRGISQNISERLKQHIQTMANVADPSLRMWISRPSTVLVNDQFLERQTVATGPVSDVSIAVCHPRAMRSNTQIYLGYISGGMARVFAAKHKTNMNSHEWVDTEFEAPATAISVAFDGTMPKANNGDVEFVTESYPWVFWVCGSVLYGRKLYSKEDPIILAETNCSDVSAIRAMWSSTGGFDFGMVVFFILEGKLYYRQLINGVWMDAELVSVGPTGVTWKEVSAFRTWDYRIGVQAKTTDGHIYELLTQFMGIGKQNTEHLELTDMMAESNLMGITYHNYMTTEHLELGDISAGAPYGGLYSTDVPVLVSARNVEAVDGDWGKIVVVEFSNYLVAGQVVSNYLNFSLVDSRGTAYYPSEAVLAADGKTVTLTFTDFNGAYGECEVRYTPGNVYSMATVKVEATSVQFTPENLDTPDVPAPEAESIWNEYDQKIAIRFTQPLVGNVLGLDPPVGYEVRKIDMSGAVASALNAYNAASYAIDGDTSTYWRGTTAVNWFQIQLRMAKTVTRLRLYLGSYYIKTFTFSGSNDGVTWTQLGGEYTAASSSTAQWYTFEIENADTYLYYRIDTLTTYSSRVYIYELELYENVVIGNHDKFTISFDEYDMVPEGTIRRVTRPVTGIEHCCTLNDGVDQMFDASDSNVIILTFDAGNTKSIQRAVGDITVAYDGSGTLIGEGGPVLAFEHTFTPEGLDPKDNPNDAEHLEIADMGATGRLVHIYYTNTSESENIELSDMSAIGVLTRIDDI